MIRVVLVLSVLSLSTLHAQDFDRFAESPAIKRNLQINWGAVRHSEDRMGLPTFVNVDKSVATPDVGGLTRREQITAVAEVYLQTIAADYGLQNHLTSVQIKNVHDLGEGPIVVSFVQSFDGIPVHHAGMKFVMDQELALKNVSGYLSPFAPSTGFDLNLDQGFEAAYKAALNVDAIPKSMAKQNRSDGFVGFQQGTDLHRVRPVYYLMPDGLVPAYYAEVQGSRNLESTVISAVDGSMQQKQRLSYSHNYRVWEDGTADHFPIDGPQGTGLTPHPTGNPDGIGAIIQAQNLVNVVTGPISTGDPWLAPGATTTSGNNAQAYADLVAPNGFTTGDIFGTVSSTNTFDYLYNDALLPGDNNTQIQATIVQAFYTINFLHDWFYDAGFDEAAGNPQSNNFGRGGFGNDPILVEVQDFNVSNNANAATPQDGASPRIQMGLFSNDSQLTVNSPASIAGNYVTGTATFGPQTFNTVGNLVLVNDGQTVGESGGVNDACETPFVNAGQISGNIALIDRGECFFADKVANAQAAGAIAVVIMNINPGEGVLNMGAPDNPPVTNIPSLLISFEDGQIIRNTANVNVRLQRGTILSANSSALDTTILAHEWGHVMNNRLMVTNSSQSGGMDEGWADFIALLLVTRPEDAATQFNGTYGVGAYATAIRRENDPTFPAYYFGIRRVPYTIDFSRNALDFRHIENGVALPTGVNTRFGQDGASNVEVHATGEVWATAMWECYVGLLNDRTTLTFQQVQQRMRNYTVAAQKAMPANSTVTEARDAVLSVMLAGDPGDHDICARAFARRGLGFTAIGPSRFSTEHEGVFASFESGLPDRDFVAIADVISFADTNAPEIMAFQVSDTLVNQLRINDASSASIQGTYSFLGSSWSPDGLIRLTGIGTSGQGLGVFATNTDNVMAIQLRNAADGALIRNVFPWSSAWRGLDIDQVPGQATAGLDAIAVLAERRSDNLMGVELKDPTSGARIRIIYPLGFGWRAQELDVVDNNGAPAVAVLATRESDGLAIVQVRDAVSGALVRNVFPLGLGWSPIELQVVPDLNGNSVDEIAVRMTRDADGLEIIQIRDALTNDLVGNVYPIGAGSGVWQTQSFTVVESGGQTLLSILSIRDTDNQVLAQLRNPLNNTVVRNNFFIGPPWQFQKGYDVIPDFNGNGSQEIAVLMVNPTDNQRLVQIRDSATGAVLRNVFQPL